jgi:hypothetical protein
MSVNVAVSAVQHIGNGVWVDGRSRIRGGGGGHGTLQVRAAHLASSGFRAGPQPTKRGIHIVRAWTASGEALLPPAQEAAARRQAEEARSREAAARQAAEEEIARQRAEVERLNRRQYTESDTIIE